MSSSPESPILLIVDNRRTRVANPEPTDSANVAAFPGASFEAAARRLSTRGLAVTIFLIFSSRTGNKAAAPVFRECGGWFHSRLK